MTTYPTLRLGVLQGLAGLKASFDADPDYLKHPDCPYDADTVKMLEELFEARVVEVIKEVQVERPERGKVGRPSKSGELADEDAGEVENEAVTLLRELRNLGKDADGELKNLDTGTRLQIIKTQAALMEKLVSIRERFTNVRKVSQFQQTVITILDDLVAEDNRDEFLKRIEPYRS